MKHELETITDAEFSAFFNWLPARTQLLVRGGMLDWRSDTMKDWYEKYKLEQLVVA